MDPDSIFIPREELFEILNDVVARSGREGVQVVRLEGETGMGKTVALKYYLEQSSANYLGSYAACSSPLGDQPTTVLKPYQLLKDIFEDLLSSHRNEQRRFQLIRNISLTVLACIPFVGDLAYGIKEIRRDLQEYKRGNRDIRYDHFEEEFFQTLAKLSSDTPVIIVVDDFQWLDRKSAEAFRRRVWEETFADRPITLIFSGRMNEVQNQPELLDFCNAMFQSDRFTDIVLPPFNAKQIQAFYSTWFPGSRPDPKLVVWLERQTGGNPFLLKSYIKHLVSESIIHEDGSIAGDIDDYTILPSEVRHLSGWILKSLEDHDLDLLLAASVLGFEFSLHELSHLTQAPVLELIRRLRNLSLKHGLCNRVGYKFHNGRKSTVYRFSQHSIQTALYNELTREEREILHRTVAQYLDSLRRESGDDLDALNSIAPALQVHSLLGNEPELELESIILKARNTIEALDDNALRPRLQELAENLDIPARDVEQLFEGALTQAPYATHAARGEAYPVMRSDQADHSLQSTVNSILGIMRKGQYAEALRILGNSIDRAPPATVHPIMHILLALCYTMIGEEEKARAAYRQVSSDGLYGTYNALAHFGSALLEADRNTTEMIANLQKVVKVNSEYGRLFKSVTAAVLKQKVREFPNLQVETDHFPEFMEMSSRTDTWMERFFPRTSSTLQRQPSDR
ncbi:MAG: AAA family ATPase [Chlorobi bacterium]|nr:AAA family ATPase [Chlorobiota bacterium]